MRFASSVKSRGHVERHDQERDGEAEHRVAQPLDARHLMAAPAKATLLADPALDEQVTQHVAS
jgi:hypothetical protein